MAGIFDLLGGQGFNAAPRFNGNPIDANRNALFGYLAGASRGNRADAVPIGPRLGGRGTPRPRG
jgi:hypothetical protein